MGKTSMKASLLLAVLLPMAMVKTTLHCFLAGKEYNFIKSKLLYGTNSLGGQWTVASKTQCLSNCLKTDACQSFMYNTATCQCIPGASVHDGLFNATSAEDELYVLYPDFRVQSYLSTRMCAVFFNDHKTYYAARDICRVYDAHLFVPRSSESYALFKSMIDLSQHTWVGLNDVDIKWKYMAEDDGQQMNINSIKSLFAPGEPNHGQYCITTYLNPARQLDDEDCYNTFQFVCQTEFSKC